MVKCPGQDQRFWKPDDIFEVKCPECQVAVEFWKDEPKRKCPGCKELVRNPKIDLGCAQWCQYAEQCLGDAVGETESILARIIVEMKNIFGDDTKRIRHCLEVLKHVQEIQIVEGGDQLVVKSAAVLHDIGIHEAEKKYGSAAGNYQEIEGPPIAEKILTKLHVDPDVIEHVCKIIANHHSGRDIDTLEFRILWDADWLVNIPDEYGDADREKLRGVITKVFKTGKGRELAEHMFLK